MYHIIVLKFSMWKWYWLEKLFAEHITAGVSMFWSGDPV